MTSLLNGVGVIKVGGPEAASYLQGQLTADIHTLTPHQASVAALCDATGRVQVTTVIFPYQAGFLCLVPHSMITATLKRLKKYALFSKVTLEDETAQWHYAALIATTPATEQLFQLQILAEVLSLTLPGHTKRRLVLSQNKGALLQHIQQQQALGFQTQADEAWELSNIEARWAQITPHTQTLFTPQMLELEKLGGVSFSKGCYVGQEIVARTQHLGKLKRHLHHVQFHASAELIPPAGSAITNVAGETIGHLVNVSDGNALAVIEDRALNDALSVGELDIHIQ